VRRTDCRPLLACLVLLIAPFTHGQVYAYFKGDPATSISSADYTAYKTYVRDNPLASAVAGITVILPWKEYDHGNDTVGALLNTSTLPVLASDLTTAAGGKKINLIILAASGGVGSGGVNTATPSWVFDSAWVTGGCHCTWTTPLDVCYCNSYQGTSTNGWLNTSLVGSNCYNQSTFTSMLTYDHSGVPAAWEPPFVVAYNQWLALFLPWAQANLPNLGYIRIGVGTGGGSVVACPKVEEGNFPLQASAPATPLTESVWLTYSQAIYSAVALDVLGTGIVPEASMFGGETFGGGDGMIPIDWADNEASVATNNGFGLAAESLSAASDIGDNVLSASGSPCSNDWCALFSRYRTAPVLGLQTLSESDPNCLGAPSTCNQTSSLLTALPVGTQNYARVFEVYYQDLLCAYDSGYTNSTTPPNNGACEAISAGRQYYPAALSAAAAGQPTSVGEVWGAAKMSGKARLQ